MHNWRTDNTGIKFIIGKPIYYKWKKKKKNPNISPLKHWNSCGNSNLGNTHNLTGQGPEQSIPTGLGSEQELRLADIWIPLATWFYSSVMHHKSCIRENTFGLCLAVQIQLLVRDSIPETSRTIIFPLFQSLLARSSFNHQEIYLCCFIYSKYLCICFYLYLLFFSINESDDFWSSACRLNECSKTLQWGRRSGSQQTSWSVRGTVYLR